MSKILLSMLTHYSKQFTFNPGKHKSTVYIIYVNWVQTIIYGNIDIVLQFIADTCSSIISFLPPFPP